MTMCVIAIALGALADKPERPAGPAFLEVVVSAIAEVETGSDNSKRGRAGERSMYQLTPAVWRSHTDLPFSVATTDAQRARVVALAHLRRLARQIVWRGYQPTAYNLALCWNGGLGALEKPLASSLAYAIRVTNLVSVSSRR